MSFDMKVQLRIEMYSNSKEDYKLILHAKRKHCKSENADTSFLFVALDMLFYCYENKMERDLT